MRTFLGQRALVVCREGRDRSLLVKQLRRLGLEVAKPSDCHSTPHGEASVLFFDLECGRDLAATTDISDRVAGPCIALLSSDTPSVIEWIIEQGAESFLTKPLGYTGVLASLIVGFEAYEKRLAYKRTITQLEQRLKARRIVCSAIIKLMRSLDLDEDESFRLLRTTSMKHRTHVEAIAAMIMSGELVLTENEQIGDRHCRQTGLR